VCRPYVQAIKEGNAMQARLVLEDGSVYQGISRGAPGTTWGEVVFNTSMTGYQEVLTDPSYCSQIVAMTFPMIGNYGINEEDFESRRPFLRGFIAREMCAQPSNWRSQKTIGDYLTENEIVAVEGIDTRALTRNLREKGTLRGLLTTEDTPHDQLVQEAKNLPSISEMKLVQEVSVESPYLLGEGQGPESPHIVILDLGLKLSIGRSLHNTGCRVTVVPGTFTAGEILEYQPDGLVLSNGPGDPVTYSEAIDVVQQLAGKVPILGVCLGHQVIALALGGKTFKLKFGHRGANHPVKDLVRDKVYITSQNHGFAVDEGSLPENLEMTQQSLNDGTVEGMREKKMKIISIQYHPEAFPGPMDSAYLFDLFLDNIKGGM